MNFQEKKVVVTGAAGFIGSNLAHRLTREGASVVAIDSLNPECGGNPFNLEGSHVPVIPLDICESEKLKPLLEGAHYIFSLAGNVSHEDSMQKPFNDLSMNLLAQMSLLEGVRAVAPSAPVVFSSTRQIYGAPKSLPVSEEHPLDPVDVNGINKLAAERYYRLYARVYGLKTVCLRLTNTYGPRQLITHARQGFIGWFVNRALTGEPIRLFGGGKQVRDFCYVDDTVEALLIASQSEACYGDSFNLSGECASLETIAKQLVEMFGNRSKIELVEFPPERKKIDIGNYYGSSDKFKHATGWQWKTPLHQGLSQTAEYYRINAKHYLT